MNTVFGQVFRQIYDLAVQPYTRQLGFEARPPQESQDPEPLATEAEERQMTQLRRNPERQKDREALATEAEKGTMPKLRRNPKRQTRKDSDPLATDAQTPKMPEVRRRSERRKRTLTDSLPGGIQALPSRAKKRKRPGVQPDTKGLKGSGPVSNKARRLQIQQLLQDSSTGEYRSERSIARIAGCDKKTVRRWRVRFSSGNLSVEDAPRQGRQPAVRDESLQAVLDLIKSEQPRSSRDIASLLSSREIANMAPRTVRKYMERTNMAHGLAVPPLSAEEKSARFAFAARHCNFDWTAVMLTDSRTFCLAKREGKVWYPRGTTPVQPLPRDTPVVHAYYGMTEHGATRPFFVVCADPQLSPANDMRSDQPENGVTADEYVQDVLYPLLDEGDRLFKRKGYANSWIFQQQGAKANASQDARDVLDAVMGERWITDWPANSPDLSCFENAWTWVNDKLDDRRPHLHSVDDLKTAVTEALQSMPLWYCKYHLRAMRRRMERVAKSDGDRI